MSEMIHMEVSVDLEHDQMQSFRLKDIVNGICPHSDVGKGPFQKKKSRKEDEIFNQ